eukprot:TRINITY_DN65103_c0_g1_i1.p1 TRINITY_DN65103_c0_g1~~TRINITY_DN65103_c0_g1_i1.p1  ORF type:complete len:262 (-),score=38.43 TRINITY_DN65103_c0_g1_i1:34-819(-)
MGAACSELKKARREACRYDDFPPVPSHHGAALDFEMTPRTSIEPGPRVAFDELELRLPPSAGPSAGSASESGHGDNYFEMVRQCSEEILKEHRAKVSKRVSARQLIAWLLIVQRSRSERTAPVIVPEVAVLIQELLGDAWDAAPNSGHASHVRAVTDEAIPRAKRELDDVVAQLANEFVSDQIMPVAKRGGYAIYNAKVPARVFRLIRPFGEAVRNGEVPEEVFRQKLEDMGYTATITDFCPDCNVPHCESCYFTVCVFWS